MRITGGQLRGRRLKLPRGGHVRPPSGRVREAVFNVVGQSLQGEKVLDLFAGSGAFGLEALSRGADHAHFVERHRGVAQTLAANVAACGLERQATIVRQDVNQFLKNINHLVSWPITLVFMDPPFYEELAPASLSGLGAADGIAPGARVVVKHSVAEQLAVKYAGLTKVWQRRYGSNAVSIYNRQ